MSWQRDAVDILTQVLGDDLNGGKVIVTTPNQLGLLDPVSIGGWFGPTVYDIVGADDRDCVVVVTESHWSSWCDLIGIACHEASHWLDSGRQPLQRASVIREIVAQDPATQAKVDLLFRMMASASIDRPTPQDRPPWADHGADWVRCCSILAHRVGLIAESIRPRHLRFGEPYYRPPYAEFEWMALLDDEIRLPGAIRAIVDSEAPQRFREHFSYATS
jgi:hypothetical protein